MTENFDSISRINLKKKRLQKKRNTTDKWINNLIKLILRCLCIIRYRLKSTPNDIDIIDNTNVVILKNLINVEDNIN
jgi:hypothetical protein